MLPRQHALWRSPERHVAVLDIGKEEDSIRKTVLKVLPLQGRTLRQHGAKM